MDEIRIIAYVNTGHARLAANWAMALKRLSIDDQATIYCTSLECYELMKRFGEKTELRSSIELFDKHVCEIPVSIPTNSVDWGTKDFTRLMRDRLGLFLDLSAKNPFVPFVYSDVDCVFVRDPIQYLLYSTVYDEIYIQSNRNDGSEAKAACCEFCCGVIYCRKPQMALFRDATNWMDSNFSSLTSYGEGNYADDEKAINVAIAKMGLSCGSLPIDLFPTGRCPWDKNPILVHANWNIGVKKKERILRDAGHWYVSDSLLGKLGFV